MVGTEVKTMWMHIPAVSYRWKRIAWQRAVLAYCIHLTDVEAALRFL